MCRLRSKVRHTIGYILCLESFRFRKILFGSLGYVTTPRQKANKRIIFLKSDEFTRMVLAMRLISGVGVEVVARPGLKAAYTPRWIVGR